MNGPKARDAERCNAHCRPRELVSHPSSPSTRVAQRFHKRRSAPARHCVIIAYCSTRVQRPNGSPWSARYAAWPTTNRSQTGDEVRPSTQETGRGKGSCRACQAGKEKTVGRVSLGPGWSFGCRALRPLPIRRVCGYANCDFPLVVESNETIHRREFRSCDFYTGPPRSSRSRSPPRNSTRKPAAPPRALAAKPAAVIRAEAHALHNQIQQAVRHVRVALGQVRIAPERPRTGLPQAVHELPGRPPSVNRTDSWTPAVPARALAVSHRPEPLATLRLAL